MIVSQRLQSLLILHFQPSLGSQPWCIPWPLPQNRRCVRLVGQVLQEWACIKQNIKRGNYPIVACTQPYAALSLVNIANISFHWFRFREAENHRCLIGQPYRAVE